MAIRDWPIKRKLTAILLLISGLVLLLTSAAFVTYEVVTFRQTMQSQLATRSRILAANSTAALAFANEADAREILAALKYDPHMVAAALYDRNGRVLATYPAAAAALQGRISAPILALAQTATAASTRQDYSVRAPKFGAAELGTLTDAFNQMLGRIEEQKTELQKHAMKLEQRVAERTGELEQRNEALRRNAAELLAANNELDAFAYSVSHDLRAPLRSIDGFSQVLLEDYGAQLDEAGRDSLQRVRAASQRMATLIDDLLKLARVTRAEMRTEQIDLSGMAREVVAEIERTTTGDRQVEFIIAPGLEAQGDSRLLRVVLDNLLRNGWKYTGKRPQPRVEFTARDENGDRVFVIKDNGAGFDMRYADKLFGVFQRLHSAAEFEGTGVGLATVRRIINRHGGRIWAEGPVDQGASFYFTL